jgi:hypothetical protein
MRRLSTPSHPLSLSSCAAHHRGIVVHAVHNGSLVHQVDEGRLVDLGDLLASAQGDGQVSGSSAWAGGWEQGDRLTSNRS